MAITSSTRPLRTADDDVLGCSGCIGTEGIARLWAAVLEVPYVNADDDFFNLGGNSLRAIRMLAEISRLTNIELGTRVLYENPTPETFHARVHAGVTGSRLLN
jgi:hypothetical protein